MVDNNLSGTRKRGPTYEDRVSVTLRVGRDQHTAIALVAKQARKPLNTYICDLIEADLKLKAIQEQESTGVPNTKA